PMIPVTRVENYCATGSEAFRGACYAVASGAYDICLALGVEKLKDAGYGGLPNPGSGAGTLVWQWWPNLSAPGAFAQLASAYTSKHNISDQDLKQAMAHVSVKSHDNGLLNPKAHLQKKITEEQVMSSPIIAHPLGLYDCCGVSDGAACAIVTTPEIAKKMGKKDFISVKALQIALSSGQEVGFNEWDGDHFMTTSKCSKKAYEEAGIKNPREEISMMEV
ncbi:MAG: acetyl-CoA acetyltransferase, partial [Desulfobacterales bacterium]|nr:acetyl-CoA acetyltransferase [Desulfobacterales bacterium]